VRGRHPRVPFQRTADSGLRLAVESVRGLRAEPHRRSGPPTRGPHDPAHLGAGALPVEGHSTANRALEGVPAPAGAPSVVAVAAAAGVGVRREQWHAVTCGYRSC
jgi:hypothetical protein